MKIEEAANYLKEELARWERDCKSNHPMKDALALAIQMLETGEVYMTGDDYNLFIKGYKDGMKDYKSLVEESDPADSEDKVRLIDANALREVIKTYRPIKCFTDKDIGKNRMVDYCLSEIDNAPTVDITKNQAYDKGFITAMKLYSRPHGKWICDFRSCTCSVCNFTTVIDTYNFCPNCGADMKGDKND